MSKQVGRRGGRQIQIGPGKGALMPVALIVVAALLVTDSTHWHLLHHLLGASSGLVALILVLVAVIWTWRISRKRNKG